MFFRSVSVLCLVGIIFVASSWGDPIATQLKWEAPGADAPLGRMEAQGLALKGKLYVFGGFFNRPLHASVLSDVYDPASNTWTALAPLPIKLTHAGQATDDTFIYLAGGFEGDYPGMSTNKFWKYHVVKNVWSEGPSLPGRRGGGALVYEDGALHYFGGVLKTEEGYVKDYGDHWVFQVDSENSTWRNAAPLPNPRNHMGGIEAGGKVYAVGGQHLGDQQDGNQNSFQVYDPATDLWKSLAPLPIPKGHVTASTLERNGRVIVITGITNGKGGKTVATIEEYNPAIDQWTALLPLPEPRQSPVSGIIDDQLIVTGGSVTATTWIGKLSP